MFSRVGLTVSGSSPVLTSPSTIVSIVTFCVLTHLTQSLLLVLHLLDPLHHPILWLEIWTTPQGMLLTPLSPTARPVANPFSSLRRPRSNQQPNDELQCHSTWGICYSFRDNGRCRFGNRCKFSHALSQGTDVPRRAPQQDGPIVRHGEDKLRTWRRLLNHTHSLGRSHSDVGRFFELALDLMDGDLGASQETITKLATDPGLQFVKNITDQNILNAVDTRSKINLWQSQVAPLFRLVTHPRAVDSNVLEQQVALIHRFILGGNASRAARLFGFVVDLAQAWPESTGGGDSLMNVLELSLALLFRLVDCNTTNIVNDIFHQLVEQFDVLLAVSSQASDNFSKLQAMKYIDYLHRRLGVGKAISDAKAPQAALVLPEEFVLLQDLPGHLSRDGPRHDNDHADISKIRIMPTYQEITAPRSEYLPTIDSSQWHLKGISGRVDREFRLLREDTVGQLRDAVGDMLERLRNPGHQGHRLPRNNVRTSTYDDATIQDLKLNKDRGLELTLRCRQADPARKLGDRERRLWWDQCKRLQPGALACVLDVAGMIQFLVVADSTLRSEQGIPKIRPPGPADAKDDGNGRRKLTLSSDKDYLYVNMHLVSNSRADFDRVLKWAREIGHAPNRRLVEFPGILLPSFQYTLEALQELSRKPDLPFTDLIAPDGQSPTEGLVVPPPLFARAPGFSYDLQCLAIDGRAFPVGLDTVPTAKEVSSRTGLDLTQSEALIYTLFRELSLM